jgi:hypothetical protein
MDSKYTELDVDLLLLAAEGGDHNGKEISRRLREMNAEERRALRRAIERLDTALDDVALEAHAARRRTDE